MINAGTLVKVKCFNVQMQLELGFAKNTRI
jgi:hypothetical protein